MSKKENRLKILVGQLKIGRPITAANFATYLENYDFQGKNMRCSPKTVIRDIDELRKIYKLQIPFDKQRNTYYLTEEDEIALDPALPQMDTDGLIATVLGIRILEELFPGDIATDAEMAVTSIINSREDVEQVHSDSFVIIKDENEMVPPEIFTPLFASWRSAICVTLTLKNSDESFIFEPHMLAMHHNEFFTKGYNYTKGVMIINLKDIDTVDETDCPFVRDNELVSESQNRDFFKNITA